MGFLMFLARKIQLTHQENNIQYQLIDINNKLNNLTDYVSILSQDSVSYTDIASVPTSMFMTGMGELSNAHYQALQISGAQFNQAVASGMFGQNVDPMIAQITQQKMYENARKQIQKQMQIKYNEEEKSLQAKKTRLEAQEKQIQQELQALDQGISSGIQSSISSFGLKG